MTTRVSPKLSLVTAIKDGLELFKRTFDTAIAMNPEEWVIVDDASTENLEGFVAEKQKQNPRANIRFFRNSEPKGQTKSLNFGIEQATGDWIVRIDGDDLMSADRLLLTAKAIAENPSTIVIFSDYDVIDISDRTIATVCYSPITSDFFKYFSENNPICHPTVTFRKMSPSGKPIHYNEDLRNAQDFALWKSILDEFGEKAFTLVPSTLVKYRIVPQSLSGARIQEQKHELAAIQTNQNKVSNDLRAAAKVLGPSEQLGMYAYRALYYDFIATSSKLTWHERFQFLTDTTKYRPAFLKAVPFFLMRLTCFGRKLVKKTKFRAIYR